MLFFFSRSEKGQGLVEYALIIVLVSLSVFVALSLLGPQVGNVFSTIIDPFPVVVVPTPIPTPVPTPVPVNFATAAAAKTAFCATVPHGTNVHVYYNNSLKRYVGLAHGATVPPGYSNYQFSNCP
jgi:pilus assembly protein Flp/PilA